MNFLKELVKIVIGPKRLDSIAIVATWFAMGAFVVSTIAHYMSFIEFNEDIAAIIGGGCAAVAAVCIEVLPM